MSTNFNNLSSSNITVNSYDLVNDYAFNQTDILAGQSHQFKNSLVLQPILGSISGFIGEPITVSNTSFMYGKIALLPTHFINNSSSTVILNYVTYIGTSGLFPFPQGSTGIIPILAGASLSFYLFPSPLVYATSPNTTTQFSISGPTLTSSGTITVDSTKVNEFTITVVNASIIVTRTAGVSLTQVFQKKADNFSCPAFTSKATKKCCKRHKSQKHKCCKCKCKKHHRTKHKC